MAGVCHATEQRTARWHPRVYVQCAGESRHTQREQVSGLTALRSLALSVGMAVAGLSRCRAMSRCTGAVEGASGAPAPCSPAASPPCAEQHSDSRRSGPGFSAVAGTVRHGCLLVRWHCTLQQRAATAAGSLLFCRWD